MTARTYRGVHAALRRTHGPATGHACAAPGCARRAADWALIGEPTHLGAYAPSVPRLAHWSIDLADFRPLCRSHHRLLDAGGSWTYCKRNHLREHVGVHANGRCRACHRDDNRRAKASRRSGSNGRQATTGRGHQ